MIAFDIFYEARPGGMWDLRLSNESARFFPTRLAALAYAIREAGRRKSEGTLVQISVEGADGRWRAFDSEMKAPNSLISSISEGSAS
jgi:hypothetical protein